MNGLFVVFLLIYLMTLITNLLIFFLILTDYNLHNPMYFFLSNLAFLDMSYSSASGPRMLYDLVTKKRSITLPACIAQIFFFLCFATTEFLLLSAMSYDRYVAICHPLRYTQIMSWRVCSHLALVIWIFGFIYSLAHILCLLRLSFCGPNAIHNFFCDLPHLFQISCTDPTLNIVLIFTLGSSVVIVAFLFLFLPYVRIFSTVLQIKGRTGKLKAFSTCTSHLLVVFTFYSSLIFIYFIPTSSNMFSVNKLFSVQYALINPLLNPLIYSLRNADLKAALLRALSRLKKKHLKLDLDTN
ncbi:olfactory receptor 2A12-like [Rana temporaria]|uniref:olfactory receptor 2A12-like n=1 Tax=Rana temporaria TaxID=8407 RepID=UPI001AAD4F07|nr:olfactory receptor 2A12-like [Rana temporaria]